jgi:glutaredoxin 3
MMATVEIYTTTICPYCVRAKALLKKKGVAYREINVERDESLRDAMTARSGGRQSVPQIFIGDRHVGGCDDLYALERQGGLDSLLGLSE